MLKEGKVGMIGRSPRLPAVGGSAKESLGMCLSVPVLHQPNKDKYLDARQEAPVLTLR